MFKRDSVQNSSNASTNKPELVGYANVNVSGLKGGDRKLVGSQLYDDRQMVKFLQEHKDKIGTKLTLTVDLVWLNKEELAIADDEEVSLAE